MINKFIKKENKTHIYPVGVKKVIKIIFLSIFVTTLLTFFYIYVSRKVTEKSLFKEYGLEGLSIKEVINRLDQITDESENFKSSVYGDKFTIHKGRYTFSYKLPEDAFYVSIAPYINSTHPCTYHSLKSCRSELKNTDFEVKIYDKNNNLVLSENRASMENGFIGIWLQKGFEGKIVVSYQDYVAETEFSTYESSITCLTTPLQLKK